MPTVMMYTFASRYVLVISTSCDLGFLFMSHSLKVLGVIFMWGGSGPPGIQYLTMQSGSLAALKYLRDYCVCVVWQLLHKVMVFEMPTRI